MVIYVRRNEETSSLKLVHFYNDKDGIPSEIEANWKSRIIDSSHHFQTLILILVLDEAFPEITIDLVCSLPPLCNLLLISSSR
jgi:hypothetical protein